MIWFVVIGSNSGASLTCIILQPTSTDTLKTNEACIQTASLIEAWLSFLQYLLSTSQIMLSFQTRTSKFSHTNPCHIPQTEIQSAQLHPTSFNKIVTSAQHVAWALPGFARLHPVSCSVFHQLDSAWWDWLQCVSLAVMSAQAQFVSSAATCLLICQLNCHLSWL